MELGSSEYLREGWRIKYKDWTTRNNTKINFKDAPEDTPLLQAWEDAVDA
jgi:hypothetical protein